MNDAYKQQVRLLLEVLPEVAKENCLALHGGTAINLFVRDMPRLSVDIDLTFVELGEREEAINAINEALVRVKERVETLRPKAQIVHKTDTCKLQITDQGAQIKIEVIWSPVVCSKLQSYNFVPRRKKNSMRSVLFQLFLSDNSMAVSFVPLWIDNIPGIFST